VWYLISIALAGLGAPKTLHVSIDAQVDRRLINEGDTHCTIVAVLRTSASRNNPLGLTHTKRSNRVQTSAWPRK
jgi:hypothetical protein